jgi:hypothetical protein
MEPACIIPPRFLAEVITVIHNESAAQNRLFTNQYSNLKEDCSAIKEGFQLSVQQTDRILAEQFTRFELRLEGIKDDVRRLHQSQTDAIAGLGEKLDRLEGLIRAEGGTPPTPPTPVTGEPLTLITPSADCEHPEEPPPQDDLFDASSPLTPISTPYSQNQEEPQPATMSPEIETPAPHPTCVDTTPRKRKRTSQGRGASKRSRRNRKTRPQEKQEDVSHKVQQPEGDHADPSIWPPVIEDGVGDQMVSPIIFTV